MIQLINTIIVLLIWMTLLVMGFVVPSKQFLSVLGGESSFYTQISCLFVGCLAYTPTNIAMLTILSAFMGAWLAKRDEPISDQWRDALARGFLVFAGIFFASTYINKANVLDATQDTYIALASAVIFLGMAVGYDPSKVDGLLKKH